MKPMEPVLYTKGAEFGTAESDEQLREALALPRDVVPQDHEPPAPSIGEAVFEDTMDCHVGEGRKDLHPKVEDRYLKRRHLHPRAKGSVRVG